MTQAYVALGSNLGDSHAHFDAAIDNLVARADIASLRQSPRYISSPMGPADQPDYLNAICGFETSLGAHALLDVLQAIEISRGRERPDDSDAIADLHWQARTLDLDLLLFGKQRINDRRLIVPHPGIAERSFVLQPLHDIAPQLVLPSGDAIADLLSSVHSLDIRRSQIPGKD